LLFPGHGPHRALRPFPTRRSSDLIFVPVGGGGLIAGVAAYVKYLRPHIKVIGVEPEDSACLHAALQAEKRITLPDVGLFADGVRSEEHTSELQSRENLVCRLLLEK